jgi:DNA polymerase III gamma/tau subunit
MSFHTDYRPDKLEDVMGNFGVITSLKNQFQNTENITSAFLFYGPPGTGKTTLGKIVASMLGSTSIQEINAAESRGIDTIRKIQEEAMYKNFDGTSKVFIFDECHMLTKEAQSALLTTVESPVAGAHFIFCSTDSQKIIKAIRERCYSYELKTLRQNEMKKVLSRVIEQAKLDISEDIFNLIIETADGIPRNALTKLGMLNGITDLDKAMDLVYKDLYESEIIELCWLVVNKKGSWKEIVTIFKGLPKEQNYEALKAITMGYLGSRLLNAKNSRDELVNFTELMDIFVGPLDYASPRNDFLLRLSMAYLR